MYQVIDDPEEEARQERGFSVWPFLIGAVLAAMVFFFVWLASPGSPTDPGLAVETPASRAAYLQALSETNPAFRRARLLDFQRVYPDTDRADAIIDQLDVIEAAELGDWEALTDSIYDVRADTEAKQAALAAYEARWNGALLGGRGEELDALRAEIDETANPQTLPDRTLDGVDSPISDKLPSDMLAGAPPILTTPVFTPPPPPPPPQNSATGTVIQPTVRRNVSPRYPRNAQRRGVEAIVVVAMDIDADGRVAMAEIVSVDAERYESDFEKAAERAAMRTRFNPKTVNGQAVPARGVLKRYIFRAQD